MIKLEHAIHAHIEARIDSLLKFESVSDPDPGFLERGFKCIKMWRFASLIFSHFS